MYLKDIKEWLKPQIKEATFYIGKIDNSKEKVIGLYNRASSNNKIAVGGLENTSTANKRICLLVHWNQNCDTSEKIAKSIYNLFYGKRATIAGCRCFFNMINDEPVPTGTDDNNVYELTIDIEIIYERNEEQWQ